MSLKYDPDIDITSEEFINEVISKIELTKYGKLNLERIREQIIAQKAYTVFPHTPDNLHKNIALEGFLKGQLVLIDLLLEFSTCDETN